jgi:hypothetical protein
VKIDFTDWQSFDSCPRWWRNFVITVCKGISGLSHDTDIRNKALADGLAAYNAVMVPEDDYDQEIDYIEFETEEDYLAFRIKWM